MADDFIVLNKNFAHFPLCYPPNFEPWDTTENAKVVTRGLSPDPDTGECRLILRTRKSKINKFPNLDRLPNRFDLDVLLRLHQKAKMDHVRTLKFKSRRALLTFLDRATNKPSNYESLENSLRFWRWTSLKFDRWWNALAGEHEVRL